MWSPKYTHERPSFLCDSKLQASSRKKVWMPSRFRPWNFFESLGKFAYVAEWREGWFNSTTWACVKIFAFFGRFWTSLANWLWLISSFRLPWSLTVGKFVAVSFPKAGRRLNFVDPTPATASDLESQKTNNVHFLSCLLCILCDRHLPLLSPSYPFAQGRTEFQINFLQHRNLNCS